MKNALQPFGSIGLVLYAENVYCQIKTVAIFRALIFDIIYALRYLSFICQSKVTYFNIYG